MKIHLMWMYFASLLVFYENYYSVIVGPNDENKSRLAI